MPPGIPRVKAWKNSLVKEFANLDCKGPREYGLRPVKLISQTVYSMGCVGCCHLHEDSSHESVKFRSALDKTVGGLLPSSVKDQLSLIARRFCDTVDEKSIEGAQNMLLDSLNCIVLASGSDDEPNQSDTNSRRNTSNSMASSDKSVLRSHGCNDHSSNINVSPPVQHSPNVTNANVDLHDTAGTHSGSKRKSASPVNVVDSSFVNTRPHKLQRPDKVLVASCK